MVKRSQSRMRVISALVFFSLLALSLPTGSQAADTEVHGYGFQGYLLSNKNSYLDAKEGTWNYNEVAVLFTSKVEDRTTVWIQLFGNSEKFGVDWAFVDYRIADDFYARAGQMKFPIGIYNEIRDNKMLQLSMLEPVMYRPDVDFIFEAYRGAGVYYNGVVNVDLFGGAPVTEEEEGVKLKVKNLRGGRLIYNTPLDGLRLMASYAAFSEEQFDATSGSVLAGEGHEQLTVGSIDFVRGGADVKAEYAKKKGIDEEFTSYYAQAGYTFAETVTPFVRYDYLLNDAEGCSGSDASCYQKDLTVGVGYKFNPYFAVKVEEHFMDGFLVPLQTGEVTAEDAAKQWEMFVAGINFMF